MRIFLCFFLALGGAFRQHAAADGERDNHPENVRRVPKLGIELTAEDRRALQVGLEELKGRIAEIRKKKSGVLNSYLPDVIIFSRAVEEALNYQEFFKPNEVQIAKQNLQRGLERANQLLDARFPWASETGLVVRGFVSKLDGTVQPYGLIVPESYQPGEAIRRRLDIWFHGRGETLSENNFLHQRLTNRGYYQPEETIVLHPYGRYSNAFKFAGEVDVLEALEDVKRRYRIDEDRISVRGFSMGGAACWQFAVHYPGQWFAANPGAGFSETPEFLKFFQKQELHPTWWEEKLWHLYDCTDWCGNLAHCPTIAYSGENDIQKQAADIMAQALRRERMELTHIIGPKMGHRIDPGSVKLIDAKMASLAEHGRERVPESIHFTTYTLKYNQLRWLTVTGLKEHWKKATVTGGLIDRGELVLRPENVSSLEIHFPAGTAPFRKGPARIKIARPIRPRPAPDRFPVEYQYVSGAGAGFQTDRSFHVSLIEKDGQWQVGGFPQDQLRKKPGLQGPIDDAFMDSFLFVKPSDKARHSLVEEWTGAELSRAIEHWRRHFRGHARVKRDTEITDEDIKNHNLILWGDPRSNRVLAKIRDQLPIDWGEKAIIARGKEFPAENHALIAIYPNPLNPERYVVLNSSFTFREFAYLNNARQVPMLPDWAVIDLRTPPGTVWPGKVADAGFFNEYWQVKSEH